MKIKIGIENRFTGEVIFELEKENNTIKQTLSAAIKSGSNLSGSDLRGCDLSGCDLSWCNLRGSDLRGCDLAPIKNDFFIVLLYSIPEISFLKETIINGKIDGSTYDGDCACLSGTICKKALGVNHELAYSQRDAKRPIERFFLGIKPGDTPENSQFSKLAFDWIVEFEELIKMRYIF